MTAEITPFTPSSLTKSRKTAGRVYLDRFSNPLSRKSMRASLCAVLRVADVDPTMIPPEDFPWEQVTYEIAVKIRSALLSKYRSRSAAHHITALTGVLKVATRIGLFQREVLADMMERGGPLDRVRNTDTALAGRMLSPQEVISAITAAASGRLKRDAAIVALAAYGGLRRAEIAGINMHDVDLVACIVTVHGKGGKTRTVPLSEGVMGRIEAYMDERGREPGALFLRTRRGSGFRNGHLIPGTRITPDTVHRIILAACDDAALATRATPHDFRRTFASVLIDEGVDLVTVRDLMGHESIETTVRYDRRPEERKKRAVSVLDQMFERKDG